MLGKVVLLAYSPDHYKLMSLWALPLALIIDHHRIRWLIHYTATSKNEAAKNEEKCAKDDVVIPVTHVLKRKKIEHICILYNFCNTCAKNEVNKF